MLKSLEKLARMPEYELMEYVRSYDFIDEIEAEVDEKYFRKDFSMNIDGFIKGIAKYGWSVHDIEQLGSVFAEYGSLDAYISKYYLPRPLFEDAEPADIDMEYWDHGRHVIDQIEYQVDGNVIIKSDNWFVELEKIDADLFLSPCEYCDKYGLDASYDASLETDQYPNIVMRKDLLERQRRLDGVER